MADKASEERAEVGEVGEVVAVCTEATLSSSSTEASWDPEQELLLSIVDHVLDETASNTPSAGSTEVGATSQSDQGGRDDDEDSDEDEETFDGFSIAGLEALGTLMGRIENLFSETELQETEQRDLTERFVRKATGREANPNE